MSSKIIRKTLMRRGLSTSSHLRKRGPGGRESSPEIKACVFGSTGFLGRYVVSSLAQVGAQVNVPFRGQEDEVRHLKLTGDLGRIVNFPFAPSNEDSVRRAMEGCDVVINLIGKDYETKHVLPWWINFSHERVNVEIPDMLSRTAKEMGVRQFIHVSALAADKNSASKWAKTKSIGEDAVRRNFPGSTIVRPADVFGDEDRFLNTYASMARSLPRFLLNNDGTPLKQPVWCNDVANAIHAMVQNPDAIDQTYELAGPEVLSTKEVVEFVFQQIRRPPVVVDLPPLFLHGLATMMEFGPYPKLTRDKLLLDAQDIVIKPDSTALGFADLGITPSNMEHISIRFLHQYRMGGHFLETS